jgi:hypothetical protein
MSANQNEKHSDLMERANTVGIDFLKTEIQTAFTFIQVAETSSSPETRARNFGLALKGYHAVLHFLPRLVPTPDERTEIDQSMGKLKQRLGEAGYSSETSSPADSKST